MILWINVSSKKLIRKLNSTLAVTYATKKTFKFETYVWIGSFIRAGARERNELVASFMHNKTAYCKQKI